MSWREITENYALLKEKNQYELMTLARNTFFSALLLLQVLRTTTHAHYPYSKMQDSLQSC